MSWIVVGLGNVGDEYIGTRHNVGRDFLHALQKKLPPKIKVILPDTYMNTSGAAIKKIMAPSVKGEPVLVGKKAGEQFVVIHDDLDVPLGRIKLSFGSGAGGHKGVLSVQKALKTKDFIRIRVGVSPTTPSGKLKKPASEIVADFVLGKFKPTEKEKIKKAQQAVGEALELLFLEGLDKARTYVNAR